MSNVFIKHLITWLALILPLAIKVFRNRDNLHALLFRAKHKINRIGPDRVDLMKALEEIILLLEAWRTGDYEHVSRRTVTLLIAALLYFLRPIDVAPDSHVRKKPYPNDEALLALVLPAVQKDLRTFREWRIPPEGHEK